MACDMNCSYWIGLKCGNRKGWNVNRQSLSHRLTRKPQIKTNIDSFDPFHPRRSVAENFCPGRCLRNKGRTLFSRWSFGIRNSRLFVRYPGNEKPQPVFSWLRDLHADARSAVDRWCHSHHNRRYFDWCSIRPVGAQVETLATINLLIEMEERSGVGNVVSLRRLTPRRTIFRAPGDNNRQAQRHS